MLCFPPFKNEGRIPKLTPTQVDELEEFICSSRKTKRMPYLEQTLTFPSLEFWRNSSWNALESRGHSRCIARRKPPISEKTRSILKSWAEVHRNSSVQEWSFILWSDETWINDGPTSPNSITKMVGFIFYYRDLSWLTKNKARSRIGKRVRLDKYRKRNSWIFCGCFSGSLKGP